MQCYSKICGSRWFFKDVIEGILVGKSLCVTAQSREWVSSIKPLFSLYFSTDKVDWGLLQRVYDCFGHSILFTTFCLYICCEAYRVEDQSGHGWNNFETLFQWKLVFLRGYICFLYQLWCTLPVECWETFVFKKHI